MAVQGPPSFEVQGYAMAARLLFPKQGDEEFPGSLDYKALMPAFGTVLLKIDENDYHGDSFVLLKRDERYGVLIFGWGSCSGCDALEGCDSYEQLGQLMHDLDGKIRWFDDLPKAKAWVSRCDSSGTPVAEQTRSIDEWYESNETWEIFKEGVSKL